MKAKRRCSLRWRMKRYSRCTSHQKLSGRYQARSHGPAVLISSRCLWYIVTFSHQSEQNFCFSTTDAGYVASDLPTNSRGKLDLDQWLTDSIRAQIVYFCPRPTNQSSTPRLFRKRIKRHAPLERKSPKTFAKEDEFHDDNSTICSFVWAWIPSATITRRLHLDRLSFGTGEADFRICRRGVCGERLAWRWQKKELVGDFRQLGIRLNEIDVK